MTAATASSIEDSRFGLARVARLPGPLPLDGGGSLSAIDIAYETYGALDAAVDRETILKRAMPRV